MDTGDILGTVIVGAVAIKLLDSVDNKKPKQTKKIKLNNKEWF